MFSILMYVASLVIVGDSLTIEQLSRIPEVRRFQQYIQIDTVTGKDLSKFLKNHFSFTTSISGQQKNMTRSNMDNVNIFVEIGFDCRDTCNDFCCCLCDFEEIKSGRTPLTIIAKLVCDCRLFHNQFHSLLHN